MAENTSLSREEGAGALPGTALDRYVVEGLLGSGGMGSVYRARDTVLDRPVALKILAQDDDGASVAAALREARACAAIQHPGVAAVYDVGEASGTAYIVMELVPGAPLRRYVGDGSTAVATRVRWLADIAVVLAYTHERGFVHRDVKPENVIVCADGVVKVLDFGVARIPRGDGEHFTLSANGALVGTPAYMAPEQLLGVEIDARADQFAWGVVAYELLSGAKPWEPTSGLRGRLAAMLASEPAPFAVEAGVPEQVAAAVMRALARQPEGRFPSMSGVVEALAPHAAAGSARSPVSSGPSAPVSSPIRSPVSGERPAGAPSPRPPQPSQPTAVSSTLPAGPRFRDPDFAAPVDLAAHFAAMPAHATIKGMLILAYVEQGAKRVPARELFARARVAERRYLPFGDYPASEAGQLLYTAARLGYPGVTPGEGLRRVGGAALDAVAESRSGKVVFGVFDFDVEELLLRAMKGYALTHSFGEFACEKAGPDRYLVHMRRFPSFLETAQVGVLEGLLRLARRRVRIRIRLEDVAHATFEVALL